MKYITVLVMSLMLLGAGGAGGYFFFQKQAIASLGDENGAAVEKKMKRDKLARLSEKEAKNVRFVEMQPIILPIIDSNGVSQVVTLIVSLEVPNEDTKKYVEQMSPRLKDAYIQDMYGVLNRKASLEGGVIKVDKLKNRLNNVSTKILGPKKVNTVLLQVVNQRPI